MAAKHKKQHSTFQAQTAIDPDSVARMSRDVGDTIKRARCRSGRSSGSREPSRASCCSRSATGAAMPS